VSPDEPTLKPKDITLNEPEPILPQKEILRNGPGSDPNILKIFKEKPKPEP